jgi:amino acid transporter
MSEPNPYGGARVVGVIIFLIAIATVIIALANTPLGEWGSWNYLFGGVVLLFGLSFLSTALANRMNIVGRNVSGRTNLIISVLGIVVVAVLVIANILTQSGAGWTVSTILTTGIFLVLGVMFLAGIPASRAKIRDGG